MQQVDNVAGIDGEPDALVRALRIHTEMIPAEARINSKHELFDGYCTDCGWACEGICYCTRDE